MNRDLKFRAWDKGHRKMSYKVNLYSLNHRGEIDRAQIDNKQIMNRIGLDCEIMQWTGLQDNYRKDIYEDDLLKSGQGNIFQVLWNQDQCCWFLNCLTGDHKGPCELKKYMEENLEVIGNIYSNPELLTPVNK